MVSLDDLKVYQQFDPSHMGDHIRELPQECHRAWQSALGFALPAHYTDIDKVVILGMGGSAIGGDLVASLTALERGPLVLVCRDYDLPQAVDAKTLIIASSYSGNTEETLSSFSQALATPSKKLVFTTGGRLKAVAEEKGFPAFVIDYIASPRAAIAHSFISLLGIFHKLGIILDKSGDVAEMVAVLEKLIPRIDVGIPVAANYAKQLATKLYGRLILVYGAGIISDVARRWKTQFNENSKAWSFYEVFPELNHNSVVGYEFPPEIAGKVFVILLRSGLIHPRNLVRYQVTTEILTRAGASHEIVDAEGESPLSQMMSLVLFGDYVSYYLALLNKTDPSPVAAIDYLKRQLALS